MAKLTRAETKAHEQACRLLEKDVLTVDDKWFVLDNWHEGAEHVNGRAGAFFTSTDLASDFRIEVGNGRIIDLCAGIGTLAFMAYEHTWYGHGEPRPDVTCIEINPAYVEIGKKILPDAKWICANVFDAVPYMIKSGVCPFDYAISNPPFGRVVTGKGQQSPNYKGGEFEYKVIDLASQIARYGAFILPQISAGFVYSGERYYQRRESEKYKKFSRETGLYLEAGCGIDTSIYKSFKNSTGRVEVATVEFENREAYADLIAA